MILRRFIRGLLCAAFSAGCVAALAGPTGYSVRSDIDKKLYRIDLATGVATEVGLTGFSKIEGLAINASGELFGVNPSTAQLVKCSGLTGACTAVGALTGLIQLQTNAGLAFAANGSLYLAMNAVIYRVDPATGGTAALGPTGPAISGLAGVSPSATCASGLYGLGGNTDRGKLYCINTTTGAAVLLGSLSGANPLDSGLDGDPTTGLVWGISNDEPGQVFAITPSNLAVSNQKAVTLGGKGIGGFESLAVAPSSTTGVTAEGVPVPTLAGAVQGGLTMLLLIAAAAGLRRRSVLRK